MNGNEELQARGISLGDDSASNIANFAKAVLNNRLSAGAIEAFVSASKGSLEMVSGAVEANVATNTSINRESMMQIQQIVNAAKDGPIDANTLTLQLQQISAIMQGQRITQLHNTMSLLLKVALVALGLVLLYYLIRWALSWIGWLLLIGLVGYLAIKFSKR
jgi:uncharacterized membrane protein YjjP (DUF1212 family)